jgi:hypothetical protein
MILRCSMIEAATPLCRSVRVLVNVSASYTILTVMNTTRYLNMNNDWYVCEADNFWDSVAFSLSETLVSSDRKLW